MANDIFPKLEYRVQEQIIDTKSMLDETNFYHQRQGGPSVLTDRLTYILGDYNKSWPISTMTVGGSGYGAVGTTKEIDDVQFTYPVMGRDTKVNVVSQTNSDSNLGKGHQPFYLYFADNAIKRYYFLQSQSGMQVYVLDDAEPAPSGGFRIKVQLDPAGPNDYLPAADATEGAVWVALHTGVAESESRSTESIMTMPGLFKNQMGFMRTGMSWAGNAANKIMKIKVKGTDGKETEVWMDWFMWQFEKNWLTDCEHFYWYSKYNRAADGTIALKDMLTGKVIPRGSGILEQIGNKSTYSEMTYNTLVNKVGGALFGQTDSGDMTITLMTGTGGMREFDRAMKDAGALIVSSFGGGDIGSKFVTGTGRNLALGGFFDTFYHIDGYTVKVKKNPIFDVGRVAMASPKHPVSGLPLESYRMVFLDDSDVDGQPNIQHVAQKGRAYIDGVIKGLTPMPKSVAILTGNSGAEASKLLSTEQDKSSYTRFKSAGIQILRANRCFDLQCVAGL